MADHNSDTRLEGSANQTSTEPATDTTTDATATRSPDRLSMNGSATHAMDAVDDDLVTLSFAEARAKALERFDRQFLSAALARNNGNIARTARSLGLHRQSLQKLMARRGIKSIRNTPTDSTAVQG